MGGFKLACGATLYSTKIISHAKGDIMHGIKASDSGYAQFGEVYFSKINYGDIKGWKKHTKMIMNLLVPVGTIRFHLNDHNSTETEFVDLGEFNYHRLCVPPGIWMAFEGLSKSDNILMNFASIEHDPNESEVRDFIL